jgi:glyoxylase-like metal-dependent hydrolase (beta-lactamase superfamily II)
VGEARVWRVEDCVLAAFRPEQLLPEFGAAERKLLEAMPDTVAANGHLVLSVHSWVVQLGGRTIIVDTGVGADKPRPDAAMFDHRQSAYLERLRESGVAPEDVDFVLHTHLHVDHVGWNTRLVDGRWVPTFPRARHVFSAKEYAFFTDPANLSERTRTSFATQADSVTPVVAAGLADMIVVDGSEAVPGFSFHPTPGHSLDHASIVLESAGARAIFAGDVLHHPVQLQAPWLLSMYDPERERTLASRRWALDFAADGGAMFFSSHFPGSGAGWVGRAGDVYSWRWG